MRRHQLNILNVDRRGRPEGKVCFGRGGITKRFYGGSKDGVRGFCASHPFAKSAKVRGMAGWGAATLEPLYTAAKEALPPPKGNPANRRKAEKNKQEPGQPAKPSFYGPG
jgi:hypothetical protein